MTIFHVIKYPVADILTQWRQDESSWYNHFPADIALEIQRAWTNSAGPYSVEMITQVLMDYEGPL